MLELYHWGPTVNSGEVLVCLAEKRVGFRSRYVDLKRLKQHEGKFLALNPEGQVPLLVHDGKVITGTTILLQYVDEAFPKKPLMPAMPGERYEAYFWIKYTPERIAPAVSALGWHRIARPGISRDFIAKARKTIRKLPPERQGVWSKAIKDSYTEDELALFGETLTQAVAKMEAALAKASWIAGEGYSLADIALLFMARAMRVATPEILNAKAAPKTWAWLKKMERRRAVKDVLATARRAEPDKLFMPGPEPARWG
jgi:glutathione S-transferase